MMKLKIDHLHVAVEPELTAYTEEKIGKIDHLLSRHARRSAHAEVKLKAGPGRGKKQFMCEVIIHLPKEVVTTNQTAETLNAAVDLAEAKLKNQLKKYKDKHTLARRHKIRRIFGRIRRR
ncbi:MAG TPA: ribosome-associated translation inhibitor RaiA [Candidatus Saccharimonadales bacterium]